MRLLLVQIWSTVADAQQAAIQLQFQPPALQAFLLEN